MGNVYLLNYAVRGIKTLDQWISLSFYKKTISNDLDMQKYNIKGIYGMNGSGKSGIVTSVNVLGKLLVDQSYLNNPLVQKNLDAIINKKTGELSIEAEFASKVENIVILYKYAVTLKKDDSGRYVIAEERLASKFAKNKNASMIPIFKVADGKVRYILENETEELKKLVSEKTTNLLLKSSMAALLWDEIPKQVEAQKIQPSFFVINVLWLYMFGKSLYVYLDDSDDHWDYFINESSKYMTDLAEDTDDLGLIRYLAELDSKQPSKISISENYIFKGRYTDFEKNVGFLYKFLKIFKADLKKIEIDKKEDQEFYSCDLIMVYDDYKIHAEFESTGIKKLIRLFAYLQRMVQGKIVFIDEFDSNLHDVYLCALLEYLMEYGQGQLCFTTHNVGPMDILKRHKKSIDFLSEDHKIYPWTANGNYSPSKLYRTGMIEGSPFNVDSTDFIGVFGSNEERKENG